MKRIRVSSLAERDLDEIWYEIAKRSGSIDIASDILDSITGVFPLLASNPKAGQRRDDLAGGFPHIRGDRSGQERDSGRGPAGARKKRWPPRHLYFNDPIA